MSNTPEKKIEAQSARDSSQNTTENTNSNNNSNVNSSYSEISKNLSKTDENLTENHTQNKIDRKKEKEDFPNVVTILPIPRLAYKLLSCIPHKRFKKYCKSVYKSSLRVKGQNNKIFILSNGEKRILKENERILGMAISINGNNNILSIGKNNKTNTSKPVLITAIIDGNSNTLSIGKNNTGQVLEIYTHGNAICEIGDNNCFEKVQLVISAHNHAKIGNDCLFSSNIHLRVGDAHVVRDNKTKEITNNKSKFIIGDHVWIGYGAYCTKSTQIPNNCIVGMGSVVTKKFTQENCVIAGSPAKICKENIDWEK